MGIQRFGPAFCKCKIDRDYNEVDKTMTFVEFYEVCEGHEELVKAGPEAAFNEIRRRNVGLGKAVTKITDIEIAKQFPGETYEKIQDAKQRYYDNGNIKEDSDLVIVDPDLAEKNLRAEILLNTPYTVHPDFTVTFDVKGQRATNVELDAAIAEATGDNETKTIKKKKL